MRRAARTDANKAEIVAALREAGATVWDLRLPVDLLVGYTDAQGKGHTLLMELKNGRAIPSAQKLTKLQSTFMASWTGGPVVTVNDVAGALRALRVME
jgi:hypothetical protein